MEQETFGQGAADRGPLHPEEEDGLDLIELVYLLWGHSRQIFLCLAAGALLAWGVTWLFITPLYEAVSSIYIVSASNKLVVDLSDLQIGSQLTADDQELLCCRPLLEDVIDRLGLETDAEALAEQIGITNAPDTRILRIAVTDPDPVQAAAIANELVSLASVYLPQIMETDPPNLVEAAVPPKRPASPSYPLNLILGGLGGAVLCCCVLVAGRLLNDTFVTPEDLARYLGVQPLAAIPEAPPEQKRLARPKRKETPV